ncbi:hypothetical protein Vadar_015189 [Vaccinium darrowii]|uniref:Uncharacterized protein n=1 Tax=Vaccinium darrowii TaxID=229202 RepID=A0ACB7ZCB0_9ERIC|nr:hypothetical protein Vadar_015189 [Vaccinium darrowii]
MCQSHMHILICACARLIRRVLGDGVFVAGGGGGGGGGDEREAGSAAGRGGIENDLSKQLYLRMFPEISSASHVIEVKNRLEPVGVCPQSSIEWESMKSYYRRGLPIYSTKAV